MIFRLRTQKQELIATVEIGVEHLRKIPNVEIRSVINIKNYSALILNLNKVDKVIKASVDFNEIANLREWMWDEYFAMKPNVEKYLDDLVGVVRNLMLSASNEYDLILE